ncbi:MAG: GNAT family N-acetyltransferase [Candidatus Omnitrophota bacterium]
MKYISLLRATEDDGIHILNWRNDPTVQSNFFDSRRISFEEHMRWYKEKLRDPDAALYISRYGNDRIGVIRFEKKKAAVSVSVNVAPHLIGKGFGSEIIRLGTERYYAETKQNVPVVAEIKIENISSQKAFRKAGYNKKTKDKAKIVFIRKPEDTCIRDKEICFLPLQQKHINKIYLGWLNDPDVTKYLETKKSTEEELKTYYKNILGNINVMIFAIEVRKRHIGNAKLEVNWKHGYANFGIMIGDKKEWGKGYGARVARLIADYAINRLNLYSVILGVYGNHTAAIRSYIKAGFHIKGRMRGMLDFEGKRVDKVFMGISRKELEVR